jgi:hypothetical protein
MIHESSRLPGGCMQISVIKKSLKHTCKITTTGGLIKFGGKIIERK